MRIRPRKLSFKNLVFLYYAGKYMNQETLIDKLIEVLNSYRILYPEKKQKIFCRYLTRKAQKKLLFYLNPHKKWVILGISHHGTKILETIPTIQMLAYENKTCMTKFLLKKDSDIKDMWIKFLIETCITIAGKTFYNYEKFDREKLKKHKEAPYK